MTQSYKGYRIELNEWNYFEGINTNDCDAPILISKSYDELVCEIDELFGERHELNK